MIVRGALAGELGCWDSRETLFSIQAVLGEVRRRLVNSYRKPLKTPSFPSAAFPLVIPLAVLPLQWSTSSFFSHLPWVKIISVSGVMIFPQVVRKRKRRQDRRETGGRIYKSQKLWENSVPESKSVCVCVCVKCVCTASLPSFLCAAVWDAVVSWVVALTLEWKNVQLCLQWIARKNIGSNGESKYRITICAYTVYKH